MSISVAIVGATGLVGQTFLKVIDEYNIPLNNIKLFASERSRGKKVLFKEQELTVEVITDGSFKGIDFALFSAGASTSLKYAKQAVSEGAIVIDNSSAFRMNKDVPLVVPEVNLEDAFNQPLIANPNCSTIQCMLPLKPLDDHFGIHSIEYNTYQAVSGSGQKGIDDLLRTNNNQENSFYPYNISKTCIPQIDTFLEDGYTKEEHKMMDETRKILHNDSLLVSATCVRVPIMHSHAVSIRVTLKNKATLNQVIQAISSFKNVIMLDDPANQIYPVSTVSNGNDFVYVGRIREDKILPNTFLLYVVADNIRKGAAANAVQIMLGVMK
jgi:aspartate-semialdehyde dehydrogenase